LANIYTEKKEEDKALDYLNEILKFDVNNKEAIIKIAAYYRDKENFEEALKMYKVLIDLDPNNADVLFNQGIAFKKMKRQDEAIANFEKIVMLNPDDNEAKIFLGRFYYESEKWQKVVDILDVNFESFTEVYGVLEINIKYFISKLKADLICLFLFTELATCKGLKPPCPNY
jgi:tetratricopeptide (TPR) repeat protein